jgi:uncharacterized protein (TIGR02246 family)
MKRMLMLILTVAFTCSLAVSQEKEIAADCTSIEALGKSWQDLWNRHNMNALSLLVAEDVDFVTVLGPKGWLKGRKQWLQAHAAMHKTLFTDSVWTTKETQVKFLRPDLGVARVLWSTTGDRVRHVEHGEPREGIFTWIRREARGKVVNHRGAEHGKHADPARAIDCA